VLSHLPRNDVDNDISQGNVDVTSRDIEKDLARSSKSRVEEIEEDPQREAWLQRVSESLEAKSPSSNGEDGRIALEQRTLLADAIEEDDGSEQRRSSTRRATIYPTTMRGIPLARLISSSQLMTRGFYVTRSENDLSTAPTAPIPANDSTTYRSDTFERTETTLISDVSTTANGDDIVNARGNGRRDSIDANSIEEDFFLSSLSGLSSKVSNDAENLSDYGEIDTVTTLARSAAKRGKSLRNFDKFFDKAAPPRSVIPSSTTPTRRKIALAVNRYNDATVPLWTGKRIVARKRNRSTLPPIEQVAITRTEGDFREAFGTSAASSTPISTTPELSETTAAWLTTPAIASKYTDVLSEASNILEDSAHFIDRTLEDSEKRTEATIGPTNPTDPIFPIPKPIASTATSVVTHGLSTPTADDPAVVDASATVTTSPAVIAVADAFAATSDTVTMTTSFATEIEDAEIETTKPQIVRYSSAITLPAITAKMNSIATTVSTAASLESRVPTIANYSPMIVNPRNVDSYESAIEDSAIGTTLESTSTTIETTHAITNYPSIVTPTIRANAHTPTTTPAMDGSPLTATVASITDTRDTDAIASATTRDLVINVNSDATTDTTANTVTPATVIDATTTDPNVTAITDANVSLAITPASVDASTTVTVTQVDPATFEPPATRASLTVSDEISSTENTWAISSDATLELSSVFDIDDERVNDDGSSVSTTAESIGITELDTVFETSRTWRTSPVTTVISRSPSEHPETSTINVTTDSFPIQTNDRLATSMPDAQTRPILLSIPITDSSTTDSSTTDDPLIAIPYTVIPSTTSRLDSVQTTNRKATLPETNEVNRGLEEASASTVAQDSQTDSQVRNRKVTNIDNETDSLQTAKEERTKASIAVDKTASKNAQNRAANQTESNETEHETENDRAFAQKFASGRRVLNRANNWIGRPLAQRPIDRYPRRRVTVHRHRGRSRRPSEYISSSKVIEDESHGGRIARKRLRVKTISGTVRPDNISEERIVHRQNGTRNGTTNATRRMRVVVKRIKEKLTEENASVSSVQGTTVLYESSTNNETRLQPRRRQNEDIERARQVASKRSRSRSGKESTTNGGIGATDSDSTDQTLPNGSRSDLRLDKTFIPERIKTRGGMRLVLKSVRRKSEERDVATTERATADSDHADNGLRSESLSNDSYVRDNLSGKENATRKRVRVVLKSVRPRFETRDVTIEQPNTNFRLHPTDAHLTRDDNFRTSENLEDEKEGKTRGRTRIVLKRVKPKFKEEKRIIEEIDVGTIDENVEKVSTNDRHESKNLSFQYEGTKVVSEGIESKSEIDSTEGRSGHLLDEEAARGDQTEAASDSIERIKFAEKDSVAEETNTDLNFAIQDPRVTFPFNFSNNLQATKRQNVTSDKTLFVRDNDSSNNNLRMDDESSNVKQTRKEMESSYKDKGTMIEQSERFDTDLRTESVARVEEDTDRLSLEVSVVLNIEDPLLDNTVYFLARSHVKA